MVQPLLLMTRAALRTVHHLRRTPMLHTTSSRLRHLRRMSIRHRLTVHRPVVTHTMRRHPRSRQQIHTLHTMMPITDNSRGSLLQRQLVMIPMHRRLQARLGILLMRLMRLQLATRLQPGTRHLTTRMRKGTAVILPQRLATTRALLQPLHQQIPTTPHTTRIMRRLPAMGLRRPAMVPHRLVMALHLCLMATLHLQAMARLPATARHIRAMDGGCHRGGGHRPDVAMTRTTVAEIRSKGRAMAKARTRSR